MSLPWKRHDFRDAMKRRCPMRARHLSLLCVGLALTGCSSNGSSESVNDVLADADAVIMSDIVLDAAKEIAANDIVGEVVASDVAQEVAPDVVLEDVPVDSNVNDNVVADLQEDTIVDATTSDIVDDSGSDIGTFMSIAVGLQYNGSITMVRESR